MRLERIALRLRRRSPWEALDLGQPMLRAWAAPAYRAWLASYWLVGLTLLLLLWPWQGLAIAILWWLKPLFDRVLLLVFSRALFGSETRLADLRQELPGLLKGPGLLSALTLRRLSMARSFLLPVWQLENQTGPAARARFRLLSRSNRGSATWLTFVCANLVSVLAISLILVTDSLLPGDVSLLVKDLFSGHLSSGQEFAINLFVMTAESIVEPFYVASGFALYLNRRSELEGWDIELAFRRLTERVTASASPRASTLVSVAGIVAVAATLAVLAAPQPAWSATATPNQPKQVIDQVLADPVFGKEVETMEWRLRPKEGKPDTTTPTWLKPYLRAIEFLSEVLRGFVWIAALLLAAALLSLVLRYSEGWRGLGGRRPPPPDFLFGLDVRPGSLPADVAAAARAALAAGRIEEALSLLYRGALVALLHRLQVEFRAGDTEDDCLYRVHDKLETESRRYFGDLLDAWRATAYAHRPPGKAQLESLCAQWPRHFAAAATP